METSLYELFADWDTWKGLDCSEILDTEDLKIFTGLVELRINPNKYPGKSRRDFLSIIARERSRDAAARVHNNHLKMNAKDRELADYDNPYKSDAHPYTIERYQRWIATSEALAQANAVKNGGNQHFQE